ncbi:hypothetical protein [Limnohabitans parvus]|uniref:Uncharacterized protein n=1 Tax=Limnohabitans parvus II-B4 TaxID=1293052 RepID=A0A315EEG3_9BURK|nr:hypothetical protein [Limnohabitans parvus]PUE55529.1 hypothetical protein B9Z37_02930 [Limnohabitans parvus II-B4]
MNDDQILAYFEALQMPEVTKSKALSTIAFYRDNQLIVDLKDCFLNQQKDADKNIRYDKLWLFSDNHWAEADISNGKIAGDLCSVSQKMARYDFSASDSNFADSNNESYLKLDCLLDDRLVARFQSFGINRKFLWDIFKKHIKPRVI